MEATIKIYIPVSELSDVMKNIPPTECWTYLPNTWITQNLVEVNIPIQIFEQWNLNPKVILNG